MGIPAENIFLLENGKVLELNENEAKITTSVPSGKILVDGLGVGDVGNIVLRDRQHLSQDGLIIIVMTMDSGSGEIVSGPDVNSRGFVYVRESENLMDDVKKQIREEVKYFEERTLGSKSYFIHKSLSFKNIKSFTIFSSIINSIFSNSFLIFLASCGYNGLLPFFNISTYFLINSLLFIFITYIYIINYIIPKKEECSYFCKLI